MMMMVTVEPGVILDTVKLNMPWGKYIGGEPAPQASGAMADRLVMPPVEVARVAVPVPVAVAVEEDDSS